MDFYLTPSLILTVIMNHTGRLFFKSNIQPLFKPQHKKLCKTTQPKDMIGPADPVSNLHHIKYAVQKNETPAERELRKHREDLQTWNEVFWKNHNLSFIQKKKEFEESSLRKKGSSDEMLSADEISVFYKDFLDKNWRTHLKYLLEWYKRNVFVTFLHLRVNIQKMLKKGS